MGTCKNIGITVFGPLLDYGLYYYDLFSDTFFTYTMLNNCHFKYFATSICIMVSSYFVTVAYLRCHVKESWRKSFMYPYHHGRNLFNQMKNNTYGNTGCRVFLWGVQNQKDFCLKINIPKGNYWILQIGVLASWQKLDSILEYRGI